MEPDFNDEQMVNNTRGEGWGSKEDALQRHPYWIRMTYFYNPDGVNSQDSTVSVCMKYRLIPKQMMAQLRNQDWIHSKVRNSARIQSLKISMKAKERGD